MGSLVMNENHPSTWPCVRGVGSKPTLTFVIDAGSRLLALRNAAHTASLTDCTPIDLPTMSWGVSIGALAADMMQNGFVWYCVPMTIRLKPFWIAAAHESSEVTPTSA